MGYRFFGALPPNYERFTCHHRYEEYESLVSRPPVYRVKSAKRDMDVPNQRRNPLDINNKCPKAGHSCP